MLFDNHEIDIAALPKVESGAFLKLDSNYLIVKYIGSFIFFLIVGFGIIGAYLLTDISDTPKAFWGLVLKLLISSMVEGRITKVSADIVATSS